MEVPRGLLSPRCSQVVVSFNDNQIAILGGSPTEGIVTGDVVLFDATTNDASTAFETKVAQS